MDEKAKLVDAINTDKLELLVKENPRIGETEEQRRSILRRAVRVVEDEQEKYKQNADKVREIDESVPPLYGLELVLQPNVDILPLLNFCNEMFPRTNRYLEYATRYVEPQDGPVRFERMIRLTLKDANILLEFGRDDGKYSEIVLCVREATSVHKKATSLFSDLKSEDGVKRLYDFTQKVMKANSFVSRSYKYRGGLLAAAGRYLKSR